MSTEQIEFITYTFFQQLINTDEKTLAAVQSSKTECRLEQGVFIFTLQALYSLLGLTEVTYSNFKSTVYASQLNQNLANLAYKVDVYESSGKVDSSWYQLVKM